MNNLTRIASYLFLALSLVASPGCGKDDEPTDPNKPDLVDPNAPTDDPVGTVTMRMRNDTDTKLGGIGGQHDFVYGASRSEGGISFLAMLAKTNKGHNKIKANLTAGAGVVTTRFQTQWIVTEYGAVNLRGRNYAERARLLISVAAPEFREELDRAAAARFGRAYTRLFTFS